MKKDLVTKLIETFKQESENYGKSLDGVKEYTCNTFYKKDNPEKGYDSVCTHITFKNFMLILEYKINISMLIPKSIVEIRFVLENSTIPIECSIYDLLDIIDKDNFNNYTFAYITDEGKMKEVLRYLIDTFISYEDKIEQLADSEEHVAILEKNIKEKIKVLLGEEIFESKDMVYLFNMLELYYVVDISRFTMDSYIDYLNGKYKKSIKKYNGFGSKLTKYEQRLVEYMKTNEEMEHASWLSNPLIEAQKFKKPKYELLPMSLSWIILTPIWGTIYYLIFYIAFYFISKDAIYVGGVQAFMLFLPAFITAIVNSFFTRRVIYKLFFRKDYDKIVALDEIENSEKLMNIMFKVFQFIIALGIVISLLTANTNITFYDNYFNNNLELLDIKGETIQYEDVYCVYKANAMMNDFGEIVTNPTYVIVLKDERQIDLYFYMEFEDMEENIIPIFESRNIEIKEIDFVENI